MSYSIPCEVCNLGIPSDTYQEHVNSCFDRQTNSAPIPCECGQLVPFCDFDSHQERCVNTQPQAQNSPRDVETETNSCDTNSDDERRSEASENENDDSEVPCQYCCALHSACSIEEHEENCGGSDPVTSASRSQTFVVQADAQVMSPSTSSNSTATASAEPLKKLNDRNPPTKMSSSAANAALLSSVAATESFALLPCEFCSLVLPVASFMAHEAACCKRNQPASATAKASSSQVREKLAFCREAPKTSLELPNYWSLCEQQRKCYIFDLNPDSGEFADVEQAFQKSLQGKNLNIIGIQRVQNTELYQKYAVHREQMERRLSARGKNQIPAERWLFHGTSFESIGNINRYGFNRNYSGKNATRFGKGVYFALKAVYSTKELYTPAQEGTGNRYMYYARVLTGDFTQGEKGIREPPLNEECGDRFDSVVDQMNNISMFVIFSDTQAYGEYVICFK